MLMENLDYGSNDTYYEESILWTAKETPDFCTHKDGARDWFLINIPMYNHIA